MDTSARRFRLIAGKKEIRESVEFFAANYSVLQMLRSPNMTVTRGDMFLCTIYLSSRLETLIRLLSDDPETDLMQLPRPFEMMHGALDELIQALRDEGLALKVHEDGTAEFVSPGLEPEPSETDLDTMTDLDSEEEKTEIQTEDDDENKTTVDEEEEPEKEVAPRRKKRRKKTQTRKKSSRRRKKSR